LLTTEQFRARLARAVKSVAGDSILIRNRPLLPEELPPDTGLSATLLKSFTGTVETGENYWIYRVSR